MTMRSRSPIDRRIVPVARATDAGVAVERGAITDEFDTDVSTIMFYDAWGQVQHISSRSTWSDRRWVFDGRRPGLVGHDLIVDWSFDLPDGSRFMDPQWAALLEAARRYLWTLSTDPTPGDSHHNIDECVQPAATADPLDGRAAIHRFADLDRAATERFLATIAQRCGTAGGRLAPTTLYHYRRILLTLYQQRDKLPDAPREEPFAGERFNILTSFRQAVDNPLPYTPDAIAVPLISATLRLIGQPAEDVIALRDRVQGVYQDRLDHGCPRHAARQAACIAARRFEFTTLDNERAPWHPPVISTKRVRFLVERIYDACFVTIAYLVGARVSEITSLEVGCIEQHASADGTEAFAYLTVASIRQQPVRTAIRIAGSHLHPWSAPSKFLSACQSRCGGALDGASCGYRCRDTASLRAGRRRCHRSRRWSSG
jgi:hypothetical protein